MRAAYHAAAAQSVRYPGCRTTLVEEIPKPVAHPIPPKENHLLTVLSLAFVLGMVVAIGVYLAWSKGVLPAAFHGFASMLALFVCPPFILSIAVGPTAEADVMAVVTAGTIFFANGFLYAGVAAGAFYAFELLRKRR